MINKLDSVCVYINDEDVIDIFFGLSKQYGYHLCPYNFKLHENTKNNYLMCFEGVFGLYDKGDRKVISIEELEMLVKKLS